MDSADEVGDECDAVFLCLADDRSTLDVAAPKGQARTSWEQSCCTTRCCWCSWP